MAVAKLPQKGDLVFFDDVLVGYLNSVEEKNKKHILKISVPFTRLPRARMIRIVAPKHVVLEVDDNEKEKRSLLVPDRRLLDSHGRPVGTR